MNMKTVGEISEPSRTCGLEPSLIMALKSGGSRRGAGASLRVLRNSVKAFLTSPRHHHCLERAWLKITIRQINHGLPKEGTKPKVEQPDF